MNWFPLLIPVVVLAAFIFAGLRVLSGKWPKRPTPERDTMVIAAWHNALRAGFWLTTLRKPVLFMACFFFAAAFGSASRENGSLLLSLETIYWNAGLSAVVGFALGGFDWIRMRSEAEAALERVQQREGSQRAAG